MSSPYWVKTLINKTFAGRFLLARLTHLGPIGRLVDHFLFENDDIFYLPQDNLIPIDQAVAHPQSLAVPSQVVEHFIQKAGALWIMDFCICRDSARCENYPIEYGCLFLGQAARDINPRFGRLVSRKEALDHVRRCREAGLVHLIGRNKLDSVWLNIGPAEQLLTICNCCPCCCLWKMLPDITPAISAKVHRLPGIHLEVTDQCRGCGVCTQGVCFVEAIHLEESRAVIDQQTCRGCGRCANTCPQNAIELKIDETTGLDQTIQRLSRLVEVS